MTKTNKRRRVVSIMLTLVMLASLIPSMLVPTHAFWDDYDTGGDCPECENMEHQILQSVHEYS